MARKVGINSSALKEFGGFLSIDDVNPDFIEISLAETKMDEWEKLFEKVDMPVTVHAPYQNSPVRETRIDLVSLARMDVVERVMELSAEAGAEVVVFHCGDVNCRYEKALENFRKNAELLGRLSEYYGVCAVLENLYWQGVSRMGETPEELMVAVDAGLDVNIDIGHAYIASLLRKRNLIGEFFDSLNGSIVHMHAHNNFGIWGNPYDSHNPLFRGLIDYGKLRKKIRRSKIRRIVLEVKNGTLEEIRQSMEFLRSL